MKNLPILTKKIFFIVGAASLFLFAVFLNTQNNVAVSHTVQFKIIEGKEVFDLSAENTYWKNRIQEVGIQQAYKEYIASLEPLATDGVRHLEGHAFGEAMYAVIGMQGSTVCDSRYMGGCLHGFFGVAMQERGIDVAAKELTTVCAGKKEYDINFEDQCMHALGHGILSYLGYTQKDLGLSLGVCKKISTGFLLTRCSEGVFMEYNVRTLLNTETTEVRDFTEANALSPCIESSKEFVSGCIFWQPLWWFRYLIYTSDTQAVFARSVALCKKFGAIDPENFLTCVQGSGYTFATVSSDVPMVAKSCALFDTPDERIACWTYAKRRISNPADIQQSQSLVCKNLNESEAEYCATHLQK